MSKIYKINYIINNEIQNIFIFKGNNIVENTEKGPKVKDLDIFNEEEWSNISKKQIKLTYIDKYIHDDDTIIRIKEKILKECKGLNSSTMEMYLFSLKQQILDPNNYYNKLTQNGHWDLTDVRLKQFLWNILENNISLENKKNFFLQNQLKKDIYEYNDILNLKLDWNKEHIITVPIGQKIIVNTNYPYIANPYNNDLLDQFLNKDGYNILSTQNSYLLFKYFPIKDNNINLCLAKDVIKQEKTKITDSYILKLYYPQLYREIKTREQLESKGARLYDKEKGIIKKYYNAYNDRIDLFYKIYDFNTKKNYFKKGISNYILLFIPRL